MLCLLMSVNPVPNQSFKKELQGFNFKDVGQTGFQGFKQDDVNHGPLNPVQRSC